MTQGNNTHLNNTQKDLGKCSNIYFLSYDIISIVYVNYFPTQGPQGEKAMAVSTAESAKMLRFPNLYFEMLLIFRPCETFCT